MPVREIARFTAEDGLARAVGTAASFLTDYTLTDLEERLGASFVRVSRADLVNIDWIDRLASEGDGSATLTLSGQDRRPREPPPAAAVRVALEG